MFAVHRRLSRRWLVSLPLVALLPLAGCAVDPCGPCHGRVNHGSKVARRPARLNDAYYEESWQTFSRQRIAPEQSPFFGYQNTCWHEWPAGGPNCEPCQTAWSVNTPLIGPFPDLPVAPGRPEPVERPQPVMPDEDGDESLEPPSEPHSRAVEPDDDDAAAATISPSQTARRPAAIGGESNQLRAVRKVTIISPPTESALIVAAYREPERETEMAARQDITSQAALNEDEAFDDEADDIRELAARDADAEPCENGESEFDRVTAEPNPVVESETRGRLASDDDPQAALEPIDDEDRMGSDDPPLESKPPIPTVIALRIGGQEAADDAATSIGAEMRTVASWAPAAESQQTAPPPIAGARKRTKKPVRVVRIVYNEPEPTVEPTLKPKDSHSSALQPTTVEVSPRRPR